jgi:hypothetical protein
MRPGLEASTTEIHRRPGDLLERENPPSTMELQQSQRLPRYSHSETTHTTGIRLSGLHIYVTMCGGRSHFTKVNDVCAPIRKHNDRKASTSETAGRRLNHPAGEGRGHRSVYRIPATAQDLRARLTG